MIATNRLIIRPFSINDLPEFEKLLNNPDGGAWRDQKNNSIEFLKWHISNYVKMDVVKGIVCFGAFDRNTGQVIGVAGAGELDDLHETEIFYNFLPEVRCKGYATEATKAITDWVFANYQIPYIIGTTRVDNIASKKVLEKCGYDFVDERTLLVHIEDKKYVFRYYRRYPD